MGYDYSSFFIKLYDDVLKRERQTYNVDQKEIRVAINDMKEVYKPRKWKTDETVSVAGYNNPAHRCAYVHKYALLYTGLVCDVLTNALESSDVISNALYSKNRITLCSLGGGPGTDVVGVLGAFISVLGIVPCSVYVLDYARDWQKTFSIVLEELSYGSMDNFKKTVGNLSYQYMGCNLFTDVSEKVNVNQAVAGADLLTMIKFISAAACKRTRKMIETIFKTMKPGAMLLFIDNAGGGFQEMLQQAANKCGMMSAFGPFHHYEYEKPEFAITRFGYESQSKTKVSVQIWMKPTDSTPRQQQGFQNPHSYPQADNIRVRQTTPNDNRGRQNQRNNSRGRQNQRNNSRDRQNQRNNSRGRQNQRNNSRGGQFDYRRFSPNPNGVIDDDGGEVDCNNGCCTIM